MLQSAPVLSFKKFLSEHSLSLLRSQPTVLQINVGKICNLTCSHCHVDAGPGRKEIITQETIDRILQWVAATDITTIDLTGGAPEMVPDFRYFIDELKKIKPSRHVIDRCNLTILLEPGYQDLASFMARHQVEIIASMPCYQPENVNSQRGDGVFEASIAALKLLNQSGYGSDPHLPLNLVYNPVGAFLPPSQDQLEADYKHEMKKHFGIVFNNLYAITNMPIARYLTYLKRNNQYEAYMSLLLENFNPKVIDALMCRDTINVSWQGEVYDCDFNQMLNIPMGGQSRRYLWDIDWRELEGSAIATANHCFGCTAGCGSSCGGEVT